VRAPLSCTEYCEAISKNARSTPDGTSEGSQLSSVPKAPPDALVQETSVPPGHVTWPQVLPSPWYSPTASHDPKLCSAHEPSPRQQAPIVEQKLQTRKPSSFAGSVRQLVTLMEVRFSV
jgi:hypothetical protein